jgi:hypothetical protein
MLFGATEAAMRKSESHAAYQPIDLVDDDDSGNDGSRFTLRNDVFDRREKRLRLLLFASIGILFTSLCVLLVAWRLVPSELDSAKRVSPFCKRDSESPAQKTAL